MVPLSESTQPEQWNLKSRFLLFLLCGPTNQNHHSVKICMLPTDKPRQRQTGTCTNSKKYMQLSLLKKFISLYFSPTRPLTLNEILVFDRKLAVHFYTLSLFSLTKIFNNT